MFVRFRQGRRHLQASLVQTRREGGKVRHEHVAGLGSVALPLTAASRLAFWVQLRPRLVPLRDWVGDDDLNEVLRALHARIPWSPEVTSSF